MTSQKLRKNRIPSILTFKGWQLCHIVSYQTNHPTHFNRFFLDEPSLCLLSSTFKAATSKLWSILNWRIVRLSFWFESLCWYQDQVMWRWTALRTRALELSSLSNALVDDLKHVSTTLRLNSVSLQLGWWLAFLKLAWIGTVKAGPHYMCFHLCFHPRLQQIRSFYSACKCRLWLPLSTSSVFAFLSELFGEALFDRLTGSLEQYVVTDDLWGPMHRRIAHFLYAWGRLCCGLLERGTPLWLKKCAVVEQVR